MTAAAAEVTPIGSLRTCAVDGCAEDSVGAVKHGRRGRGLDAYCQPHKDERVAELTRSRVRASELRSIETDGAGLFEKRALALAGIGRDLDSALAAEAEATAHADEQRRRWSNALVVLSREANR